MLSILIPVYNFDVRNLVYALHQQAISLQIPFEILCFDDGSQISFKEKNRELKLLESVKYEELPQNLGRSAIRNKLADAAQFDYLLFMDCDSGVTSEQYLKQYLEKLHEDRLLYGGRTYQTKAPAQKDFLFHWWYGINREQVFYQERKKQPYHSFMTNNFLIPKGIFEKIRFDERLLQYGHEDTLFGLELKNRQIEIIHLDNPLEHLGLEETNIFLEKTRKGIDNLYFLWKQGTPIETKLLKVFQQLKRWRLTRMIHPFLSLMAPYCLRNFRSAKPNLKLFDLYKLLLLINEDILERND